MFFWYVYDNFIFLLLDLRRHSFQKNDTNEITLRNDWSSLLWCLASIKQFDVGTCFNETQTIQNVAQNETLCSSQKFNESD